ncbi:MAG: hypothetical protein AAF412_01035 [Pseudomonadota bacterium]
MFDQIMKALGELPKWFKIITLASISVLLVSVSVSVTRTLFIDCGSIELQGTSLGNHCQYVPNTHWEEVSVAPQKSVVTGDALNASNNSNPPPDDPNVERCINAVNSVMREYSIQSNGKDRDKMLLWFKLRPGSSNNLSNLTDVIFHCNGPSVLAIFTGAYGKDTDNGGGEGEIQMSILADKIEKGLKRKLSE